MGGGGRDTEAVARRVGSVEFIAFSLLASVVALLAQQSAIRELEAWTSARVVDLFRVVPATSVGKAVVFPLAGRYVGYTMAAGCSVTMLVAPFFLLSAALIISRRIRPSRGVGALGLLSVALFAVNQTRLLVIAVSMRAWGFRLGYERSHIFLGTVLSTLGVVAGVLVFVWVVAQERSWVLTVPTDV